MDIQITWDNTNGVGDWTLLNGDLAAADSDLLSSVTVMLFSDARVTDDYTPGDGDPRGWWGSSFRDVAIGSTLWQLFRTKFASNTSPLLKARDYTKTAMQPFIDQGIAKDVSVDVQRLSTNSIAISIVMTKPDNTKNGFSFSYVWNQLRV